MKKHILGFTLLLSFTNLYLLHAQSPVKLWYNQPAQYFEETLVPGTGKTGATVFGGADSEKNYLNDAMLCSGEPVNASMNPDANKKTTGIREALKNNDYNRAEAGKSYKLQATAGSMNYVFAYFKNNGKDGLHLAGSNDGLNWKAFKNDQSFIVPQVGKDSIMRDPCIVKGLDGQFHMVWTDSWTDRGIGYASSKDLIHWSAQVFIPVMQQEDSARNCWAPEITLDPLNHTYMIYWATTIKGKFMETYSPMENGYNHRMYYVTTKDFKTFSETKLLYDPGFNVIDATIVREDGRYIMFMKDETREPAQKNLKIAYSDNLTGPYTAAGNPITGNYWAEGPTCMKKGEMWIVYFDKYRDHKYGAIQSTDLINWTDISDRISLPTGLRHGTIFTVNKYVFNLLEKE